MENVNTTFVGMDVHKAEIVVAMLLPGQGKPVEWSIANDARAVQRLAKRLQREAPGPVSCAYEAGPCGYAVQRQLRGGGVECQVVAPSLIPVKPGEHVKTDHRDARKLAELLRAGLLTEVHPPTAAEEAIRDLCRCREDAKEDLTRARHRLSKFLLRRAVIYGTGRRPWTQLHRRWLHGIELEHGAERAVLADYLAAIELLEERLRALDEQLALVAEQEPLRERVGWLRCFRGIDTLTAVTLLAELHDFRRFSSPRKLMAYLGLVPSEHSSAESVRRGGITKAGNSHARRVLIESSWHYRHPKGEGAVLRRRREGQPIEIIALADRAQQRLHRRYCRLALGKGKPTQKVVTALARELAGFVWSALYLYPQTQPGR